MWKVINRVLKLSGNIAKRIKLSFLFSFIDSLFEMAPLGAIFYSLHKFAGEGYVTGRDIVVCVELLIIGIAGGSLFKYLVYRFQSSAGFEFVSRERLKIGDKLRNAPMGFFHEKTLGDLTATATTDLNFLELYSMHVLDKISNGTISILTMSIFTFWFDWRVGLIFTGGMLLSFVILSLMQKTGMLLSAKQKIAQTDAISATLEYVQGISVIKAFNMNNKSLDGIESAFEESNKVSYNIEKGFNPLLALYDLCFKTATCLIMLCGVRLLLHGEMSFIYTLVILIASFTAFSPIEIMGQMTLLIRMMEASLDRVEKIKDAPQLDEKGKNLTLKHHNIEFDHVKFSYNDAEPLLSDISFSVPEKTMTAIVGSSGCGKTTITRLIARFWDVKGGSIRIGDTDIRNMTCDSLLSNISMVFQNVYLFHDTIRNNIKLGNPNASEEEVMEAAKKACCHEFISSLPDGYETIVGEGGSTLSGGEKQRISIARAILKNAPIILLDEATASVDPENEVHIQQAINTLVKDKTLIVIAHRLSTIKSAQQILVVNNGIIEDIGTHEELLARKGMYYNFWTIRQEAVKWKIKK